MQANALENPFYNPLMNGKKKNNQQLRLVYITHYQLKSDQNYKTRNSHIINNN